MKNTDCGHIVKCLAYFFIGLATPFVLWIALYQLLNEVIARYIPFPVAMIALLLSFALSILVGAFVFSLISPQKHIRALLSIAYTAIMTFALLMFHIYWIGNSMRDPRFGQRPPVVGRLYGTQR